MGLSDKELEYAYLFDFRVRNALGKEALSDNIYPKTFSNFRRRLLEHEEETGHDLLLEVFEDYRSYFQQEFDIDGTTQRMDSTFIEANIKQLSGMDLIAKVLHNLLCDLPAEIVQELPAGMTEFADRENLELSYQLDPGEIQSTMETLAEHAAWLVGRFEDDETYADGESFAHLQQVLDEQCYRMPDLEDDESDRDDDDGQSPPGDSPSPGWEPVRTVSSPDEETEQDQAKDDTTETDEGEAQQDRDGLKQPDEIGSDTMQNPHDDEATYRQKNDKDYFGYKANIAETCGGENPFRLITAVRVDTNNTDDADLLEEVAAELPSETGLIDLLVDGGYTSTEVEARCRDHGISQHFTGLRGQPPPPEKVSLADAEWEGHRMVACPAGHEPFEQRYMPESGRISGRMDKEFCGDCPREENCFVNEKQKFYSYGFYERKLALAHRRKRMDDPAEEAFLNFRAGAESLINELYHQGGTRTKFTGTTKVENASVAKAIGTNLKRASRFLESEAQREQSAW